jgi:hypothetical protein
MHLLPLIPTVPRPHVSAELQHVIGWVGLLVAASHLPRPFAALPTELSTDRKTTIIIILIGTVVCAFGYWSHSFVATVCGIIVASLPCMRMCMTSLLFAREGFAFFFMIGACITLAYSWELIVQPLHNHLPRRISAYAAAPGRVQIRQVLADTIGLYLGYKISLMSARKRVLRALACWCGCRRYVISATISLCRILRQRLPG